MTDQTVNAVGAQSHPATIQLAGRLLATVGQLYADMRGSDVEGLVLGNLTIAQASVLGVLIDAGPTRVTDLAGLVGIATPSMTIAVKRLEGKGLAKRTTAPRDRRIVLVDVTEKGAAAFQESMQRRRTSLDRRIERLSDTDQQALQSAIPVLRRLVEGSTHFGS